MEDYLDKLLKESSLIKFNVFSSISLGGDVITEGGVGELTGIA